MFEKLREKLIPKNQNSRAYRMQFARSLHGKSIRYVTERDENAKEHVIGHRGSVSLRDGELLVFSDGEIIFSLLCEVSPRLISDCFFFRFRSPLSAFC